MNPSGVNLRETVVPPENQRLVGLLARRPFIWRVIRVQYRYRYAWQWRNDCPRAHAAWLGTKGAGTCMVPGLTLRPSCGQCSAFASIFAHLQEKRGSRSPGTGGMAAKCVSAPSSHSKHTPHHLGHHTFHLCRRCSRAYSSAHTYGTSMHENA